MNIQIICVGKLKEKYWKEAVSEYRKRLGRYCKTDIIEVKEELLPDNSTPSLEDMVKAEEGHRIINKIKQGSYIIALDVQGKEYTSEGFAKMLYKLGICGRSDISLIIGGSLGLSDGVLKKSDFRLSFSKMTYPHQMMRVILMEQLYRSFKINRNEPYHK